LDPSENSLIEGLRNGDQLVVKSIFDLYYTPLTGYAHFLVNDAEAAREIVQEVFLNLWKDRARRNISSSLKSYLFTAVYNRSLNWKRHQQIVAAYRKNRLLNIIEDGADDPPAQPFLQEFLLRSIEALPLKTRLAFTAIHLDELSYHEASLKLGVSIKTIENQVAIAKKTLREKLADYR